jgi:hypothetical protein
VPYDFATSGSRTPVFTVRSWNNSFDVSRSWYS